VGLLASVRERRFGETALTFYRAGGAMDGDAGADVEANVEADADAADEEVG